VLAAFAILSMLPGSPIKNLLKPVQLVTTPAQSLVKSAGDTLTDFWSAITDGIAIREENKALKERVCSLERENLKLLKIIYGYSDGAIKPSFFTGGQPDVIS
jgi:hypothetical protein